jgi:hypothetical protein
MRAPRGCKVRLLENPHHQESSLVKTELILVSAPGGASISHFNRS